MLDQQKLVAALMVLLKRAQKKGSGAVYMAEMTLLSNITQIHHFTTHIPDEEAISSLASTEQSAAAETLTAPSLLAEECASASRQPLEVST